MGLDVLLGSNYSDDADQSELSVVPKCESENAVSYSQ
jgi:hypothetical protein